MEAVTSTSPPLPPRHGDEKSDAFTSGLEPASYFYTMLPPIVQRRVPRIRSLRRTASIYSSGSGKAVGGHSRSPSEISVTSLTPPPSYRTSLLGLARSPSSVSPSRTSSQHDDDEELDPRTPGATSDDIFASLPASAIPSRRNSRPSSSGSATPPYTAAIEETDRYGVQWKFANQGYSLLSLAAQEANSLTSSAAFGRRLYIDAIGYLLRGLPTELSQEETSTLRAALPESLTPMVATKDNQLVLRKDGNQRASEKPLASQHPAEASLLHRCTAQAIVYIFLALNFLIPYIQLLVRFLYTYDRKHHISDRLIQQGLIAADSVGKQTFTLARTVGAMNDGIVAERMREAGVWWVRGVAGGVYEGFGEGLEVLGLMEGPHGNRVVKKGEAVEVDDSGEKRKAQ